MNTLTAATSSYSFVRREDFSASPGTFTFTAPRAARLVHKPSCQNRGAIDQSLRVSGIPGKTVLRTIHALNSFGSVGYFATIFGLIRQKNGRDTLLQQQYEFNFKSLHNRAAYGEFSNFYSSKIYLDGKSWPTTEHYFQAQKFLDEGLQEKVRTAGSPGQAARIGRDRKLPLRSDWESVKDGIMETAVYTKFSQHKELKAVLLGTGDAVLIEHTSKDHYWADGGDGSGKNMLGKILMRVRDRLRLEMEENSSAAAAADTSSS